MTNFFIGDKMVCYLKFSESNQFRIVTKPNEQQQYIVNSSLIWSVRNVKKATVKVKVKLKRFLSEIEMGIITIPISRFIFSTVGPGKWREDFPIQHEKTNESKGTASVKIVWESEIEE